MSQNEAKTSKLIDDQFGNSFSPMHFDQNLSPNQFLPQLNGFKVPKSPKTQHRNASCNPYNQTLPVHEYVTLEFSNPIAVNAAKLVSRERKPIPIVDPETKQVMNASQLSLTKSSSQANSIDLNEINKEVQYQIKQSQIPKSISLHIGRRDLPKNNQINAKTTNESASKINNKRSETRDQKNTSTIIGTKSKMIPRAQSTLGTTNKTNPAKNINNSSSTINASPLKDNKGSKLPIGINSQSFSKDSKSTDQIEIINKIKLIPNLNLTGIRKRYDKMFLLSLKDKNESKIFPKELKGFEYASNEIDQIQSNNQPKISLINNLVLVPPIEKSNTIKTYAAAAATAIKTSPSLGQIKPSTQPQPIKRSTTRERISEVNNKTSRARSVATSNKQKLNENEFIKPNSKTSMSVAAQSAPKRTTSQVRSSSVAKHTPRGVEPQRVNKPEFEPKIESSLKNSKTYDVIPSIPFQEPIYSKDPREEKLEQKLLPIFNQQNLNNYTELFLKSKVEFQTENENKSDTNQVFVRALASALCLSCFDGRKLDIGSFIKRYFILKEFTQNDSRLEIEILNSIQALDHKLSHIPGFISVLFEIFYTENFISEEIFLKWRDNPIQEGHNLSVYRLKEFFELLADLNNSKLLNSIGRKRISTLTEDTKSSIQKKTESIATSVSNTRRARLEKSKNKLNSIFNNSISTKVESTCSKCLQSISNLKQQNIQLMSTICGHIICKQCANKLLVNSKLECPICKKILDKASIHDIFL